MAYGDSPFDKPMFAEWSHFCDQLKAAGKLVFKDVNPPNAEQRVDGFRYLMGNLSQAYELALETKNTKYPGIYTFCSPTRKLGGDNADCVYMQAWVDGSSVYKISGKKGTARFWNIAVQGPRSPTAYGEKMKRILHDPFGDVPEQNIFGHQLKTNWDGTFELFIGGEKQGQNWLPTTPGTRKLFLRQYFDSWDERSAEYRIERIGMTDPRPIPTPEEMIEAMKWAGEFVYNVVDFWPDWGLERAGGEGHDKPNQMIITDKTGTTASGKATLPDSDRRRGRAIGGMWWKLAGDEALILEFPDPKTFWMITCMGVFSNSMDYLYRPISYTPSRTTVDPDGKVRLVLTKNDPGYHNWIDNQGYTDGQLTFRNILAEELMDITPKVVKVAALASAMHAGSRKVTPEERTGQMMARFDAINRRYRL